MDELERQSVLMLNGISPFAEQLLGERFAIQRLDQVGDRARFLAQTGPQVRTVATGAGTGFPDDLWEALPALETIVIHGVGTDRVDLEKARRRNVTVLITPDILSEDVADFAIGLWIGLSRRIVGGDNYVRDGKWRTPNSFPLSRRVTGQKVGIVGLGRIGLAIARRAEPFASQIAYTSRNPVLGVAYRHELNVVDLAKRSDVLFVAVPGGKATEGLIGAEVLTALGPSGMLVNVARGSVLDEAALISALREGRLGGAALDVFRNEPNIDPAFAELENVLLQPHQASATVETRRKMAECMVLQLREHFSKAAV